MIKLSKEKRDKLILVGMATVGILAVLYLFVITTQQTALEDYGRRIDQTKDKLDKAQHWLRMGTGVKARLAATRHELEAKQDEMAPLDKFKWFYNTLDKSLAQHRVKLVDITREPEIGDVGVLPRFPFQAATFGVKLNAHFHDFGAFLADFENEFPYMRVQNLELAPDTVVRTPVSKESAGAENHATAMESLAITLRVVTLVKPTVAL